MLKRIKIIKSLFVVIIISSNAIFAQTKNFEIGLHGASSISLLHYQLSMQGQERNGGWFGLACQFNYKPTVGFRVEVTYERKGFIYSSPGEIYDMNGNLLTNEGIKQKYFEDYLVVPVMAKLKINRNKISFFTNLGIYGGYLLRTGWYIYPSGKIPGTNVEVNPRTYYWDNVLYDFGIVTGLGCDVLISNRFSFSVEARNNLGLYRSGTPYKNESLGLLFGLEYKLNKTQE